MWISVPLPKAIWLARTATILGFVIPAVWLWTLWDFLHGRGPSPGAGAQYVFVLIPTLALATILLGVSTFFHATLLQLRPPIKYGPIWGGLIVSGLGFGIMIVYWVWVGIRVVAA